MSADNGVFIVDIPHGYAVIEATMQQMPSMIRNYRNPARDYKPEFHPSGDKHANV